MALKDLTKVSTHSSWAMMKQRCNNSKHHNYPKYGGRGIMYDPRWEHFKNFLADMGERPEGKTLDRYPDKDGNYCKENCRWATPIEQANNRRKAQKYNTKNPRKGVSRVKFGKRWMAYSDTRNHKRVILYCGPDLEKAIIARKSWEDSQ